MLVIADGFRRLILLLLLLDHLLILLDPIGINLVQIRIALVPKGTGSVPQSMEKRNWEISISDQNRSAFSPLLILYFHCLMLHLLKSEAILHNQHIIFVCCLYHLYLAVVCLIIQYDCFSFPYFFIYIFLKSCRWFVEDIITVFKMLNMISDSYYLFFFIIINCSFYFISCLLSFCNYVWIKSWSFAFLIITYGAISVVLCFLLL